jgi:predicted nucleic acid-binding protein
LKRILIDTSVYASFKRKETVAIVELRRVEYIGINIMILGEILSGFKGGKRDKQNIEELNLFLDSQRVHLIQIDEETAAFYAEIYWDLRRKGKPVPSNDMWVAASAMKHGLALFTFDEHFNNINVLLLKT